MSSLPPMPTTLGDKIAMAEQLKNQGNALFAQAQYQRAAHCYNQIPLYIAGLAPESLPPTETAQIRNLKIAANSNLSGCYLNMNKLDRAAECISKVLAEDPQHVKALFRRAKVRAKRCDFEGARADLQRVDELNPAGVADTALERRRIAEEERRQDVLVQQQYAAMFAADGSDDAARKLSTDPSEGAGSAPPPTSTTSQTSTH
eukprot:gnl/Spiro4/28111_TR13911_c0_g1_i1.p2 gnl/Spiro4/28111_TR13911_c0_g1~~gnl/Spiro4/28111_TR13911_c0_g1_i1.p2  ORF type:complete len:203 (-),score=66.60 gnl/Spiro4/28111_TR13911_c0_g1_i1:58-666(-)